MRLLLVEPDAQLGERLQQSLESEGYLVDRVGSLAEARTSVIGAKYSAVLMDIHGPDSSRSQVRHRMRADAETTLEIVGSLDVDLWFG